MYRSTFFLISAIVGDEWSASCPGGFNPGTHWIGGWVGPRAGLDDVEKINFLTLPGLELRPRSQSLYRLRYPGSLLRAKSERKLSHAWLIDKPIRDFYKNRADSNFMDTLQ
jgi:hypothetical protein